MAVDDRVQRLLRKLGRDQWVRVHGVPRVTVIAGRDDARAAWTEWLRASGSDGATLDGDRDFDAGIREAFALALAEHRRPVAVIADAPTVAAWRAGRTDRLAALVDEGFVELPVAKSRPAIDARSAAEAALFEALEATPATRGRFELNGLLSVHFGSGPAEVDLLDRAASIAVEIDGYHHFTDARSYRRDRRKDLLLQSGGFLVVRVLADDVLRDAREAVTTVCQALAARREDR